ncbi:4'-phosphopantetheinyl transferase [Jatrophihabitans sp. GAS493]|uniref:4'-phosphopantetheinyl transferase family protein n=1 Tax=Jatrophihabitans sp. GAS493 TaxID=1907575 RepID=UPI000BB7DB76|nr:4'-phosphopantetheinyl transferase superfamily protein [Jatrophihabitans sp. GAS493]SOD70855.1 4'-phosphopantetheinyl transferase [Jatrophihabitans sp. GAS493]
MSHAPLHLWLLDVATSTEAATTLAGVLDEAEQRRLAAISTAEMADRYLTAHVALRSVLAGYVGVEPQRLVFARDKCPGCGGDHGRPILAGAGPQFSLTHSGDAVLIAVADRPVGVDVERARPGRDRSGVISRLHPMEREMLRSAPTEELFLDCWTRKEAYLKATGIGMAGGLASHYTGMAGAPEEALPSGWSFVNVEVPEGYWASAAIAGAGGTERVLPRSFSLG